MKNGCFIGTAVFSQIKIVRQAFAPLRPLQQSAASMPPTMGATMNTHTTASEFPPRRSAGPNERAGFTLVPVK